ncbi:2-desacetyl-2-hydroxyethyl bacteriochlorophyllide A dehydrogenase [Actinocorallia herbida]|uniref:2-desacetyl-2-hydroxyethyl bacteriochlorophyllide A dehydrogenase n=1 Tax=Actinocorallia herbida TaxID=58109 RepID=A0A3N1D1X3_9ACTN|nr:zinc-binding dehydrogenase [Actinocorallia herbida]ROO87515.1 2-desacetyl-2-hydroxyethyl bacteriochlorophyllide A dehydrogenase [Actinocorallia herbida]
MTTTSTRITARPSTMRSVRTGPVGMVEVVELDRPVCGPRDAVVRIRACGICGTDAEFLRMGGIPFGPGGSMIPLHLGHEAAGEIVELGAEVTDFQTGDHVVVSGHGHPSGLIGCGGALGGMREYLLVEDAASGANLATVPADLPFDIAALNEPMAVALHCVNRSEARPEDKVVVFGAGPIGLGVLIWLKLRGVENVVVADVRTERLGTALRLGADAVIDSGAEDVTARLTDEHGGAVNALGQSRAATDIYIDAAGAPAVFDAVIAAAKWKAKMVMVAVQKPSATIDLAGMLRSELTLIASQGYPTEIFEAAPALAEHREKFAHLISHRIPFDEVDRAYALALTPGAAEKVIVTFDDPR